MEVYTGNEKLKEEGSTEGMQSGRRGVDRRIVKWKEKDRQRECKVEGRGVDRANVKWRESGLTERM